MSEENFPIEESPAPAEQERKTFFLEIAFDGTGYHGWQKQPNCVGVQEVLEDRLSKLFNQPVKTQGSSRTDAGVHALALGVSFVTRGSSPYIPDWKIKKALNRLLPPSIKIISSVQKEDGFNARFDSKGKTYCYVINRGELNPFSSRYSWHLHDFTRLDEVAEALKCIEGTHDFSSFTVERTKIDDPVRTIYRTGIQSFGNLACIEFTGDGFLYKMIRSLMGTLSYIGQGRLPASAMKKILEKQNRTSAHDTVPPQGLFLMKVYYEDNLWQDFKIEAPPFFQT